jgi:hypothetical protein
MNITNMLLAHKRNVDKDGFSIQWVNFNNDRTMLPFAYTVGLAKHGYPDMYIAGDIACETIKYILKGLFNKWQESGLYFGEAKGLLKNDLGLMMLPILEASRLYVSINKVYYKAFPEHNKVKAELPTLVQVLWPDTNGAYPTEARYNKNCIQPVFCNQVEAPEIYQPAFPNQQNVTMLANAC